MSSAETLKISSMFVYSKIDKISMYIIIYYIYDIRIYCNVCVTHKYNTHHNDIV